jgi:hypothetical protein
VTIAKHPENLRPAWYQCFVLNTPVPSTLPSVGEFPHLPQLDRSPPDAILRLLPPAQTRIFIVIPL